MAASPSPMLIRVLPLLLALALLAGPALGAPVFAWPAQQSPATPLTAQDWAAIQGLLPLDQQAYFKAAQVSANDAYGWSVAVDGDTVVVGAFREDSGTPGVQNTATPTVDESATDAGAAYVFVRSGTSWSQQAYLKASQVTSDDAFGSSVAVAGDTIVVGANREDSSTAGVQNTATPIVDEAAGSAGAAYVFVRSGTNWSQQAYLKASQVDATDLFGAGVAVAGDTIVVGANGEASSTTGVQNTATPTVNETTGGAGAAFVFVRSGAAWSQQAYLKASEVSNSDNYGTRVDVDSDTIVVGSNWEDSSTAGVQNSAMPTVDNAAGDAGAAYVYGRSGGLWSQQAYLKASQVSGADQFGWSVAVSGDTIVVGANLEDSSTAGVQNSAAPTVDESAANAGAAYVFVRSGGSWSQQAYLKASQVSAGDQFGYSVVVDGETLLVGARMEDSSTAGVQRTATPSVDEGAANAGAAYGYGRSGTSWSQQVYLKASQVSAGDSFGTSVAISAGTLLVGALLEDSSTSGVQNGATPTVNEGAADAGAAYGYADVLPAPTTTPTATTTPTNTPTGTATNTPATNTPTPTATNTPTGTATPTSTRTPVPAGPVYLPLLFEYQPKLVATLNGAVIPEAPVSVPGAAFYTATITLPTPLPAGGAFYLSGSPTSLTPGLVDDGLIMRVGGTEIFRHDYGATSRPLPALVPVPRAVLAPWAGQAITVQFVDFHGSVTQASPLYLVWQP